MAIFRPEKAVGLFQNRGGDIVCCSTLALPGGAGEEAASCLCSCLGVVSYTVFQVRNLGTAHANALRGAKNPGSPTGQQQMPG